MDKISKEQELFKTELPEVELEAADGMIEQVDNIVPEMEIVHEGRDTRMVPLKALEAERKKFKSKLDDPKLKMAQDVATKLQNIFGKDLPQIYGDIAVLDDDAIAEELGISKKALGILRENQRQIESVRDEMRQHEFSRQLGEMASSPYYSDAYQYAESLQEYAKQNKCDIKTAYNILFAEQKFDEIKRSAEQQAIDNFNKRQVMRLDAVTSGQSGGQSRTRVKLTKEQMEVAKAYGMTPEEYVKYMM